jgi:hypothetical protein
VSIVRVGLSETKEFSRGYDAIFGAKKPAGKTKKSPPAKKDSGTKAPAKKTAKKKKA